jgi:hypothetical protein
MCYICHNPDKGVAMMHDPVPIHGVEPKFYSAKEVSRLTSLSAQYLAKLRMTADGDGPPFTHIGRRVIYPADLMRRWVEDRRAAALSGGR